MKKISIGLLPRIIIAILLGILFGNFLPIPLVRLFITFNGIFSEYLNFSIPLIIMGLVTIAIADIGKGAGRMLLEQTMQQPFPRGRLFSVGRPALYGIRFRGCLFFVGPCFSALSL